MTTLPVKEHGARISNPNFQPNLDVLTLQLCSSKHVTGHTRSRALRNSFVNEAISPPLLQQNKDTGKHTK
jgi:hypothetical protein